MQAHREVMVRSFPGDPIEGNRWLREGVLSAALFLLLAEWMHPLAVMSELTDLYMVQPFLIAIGCFLLIDYLRVPEMLGWIFKVLLCAIIIAAIFHHSIFSWEWWAAYVDLLMQDSLSLLTGHLDLISPENRTMMFLVGWALLTSVIQSVVLLKQRGLWFVAATLLYLTALQLWPGVDTNSGLVRTMVIGLVFLSLLQLPRLNRLLQITNVRQGWPISWLLLSGLIAGGALLAGLHFSQEQSRVEAPIRWDAPFRWMDQLFSEKAVFSGDGESLTARSGYGNDDSRLGGGLQLDSRVAFVATTELPTYWRGEAKNIYTGKGWVEQKNDLTRYPLFSALSSAAFFPDDPVQSNTKTLKQEIILEDSLLTKPLFSGGAILKVESLSTAEGQPIVEGNLLADLVEGKTLLTGANDAPARYRMQVQIPQWTDADLRKDDLPLPPEVAMNGLQLPDSLPERVKQLASNITRDASNNFDRVQAVQNYLRQNYAYNVAETHYPPADRDFVDYFLFTQKFGYCDYFSTAMAVLLRSVGVPARWVKGFAPGEIQAKNGVYTATVRNLHAHSWVEVYFPSTGWIAFESTPGFSGHEELEMAGSKAIAANGQAAEQTGLLDDVADSEEADSTFTQGIQFVQQKAAGLYRSLSGTDWRYVAAGGVILVVLMLCWLLVRTVAWQWYIFRRWHKVSKHRKKLLKVVDQLWVKIFQHFGALSPQLTLREYVCSIKATDEQRAALNEWIRAYELLRYGAEIGRFQQEQNLLALWKKIWV